ncbi:MAG: hypothetical protein AAFX52_09030 [Pseudomonadota bacterium]
MTLPLRHEENIEHGPQGPRPRNFRSESALQSPANQLLSMLQEADLEAIRSPEHHVVPNAAKNGKKRRSLEAEERRSALFGTMLLVWALLALITSVSVVAYDALKPVPAPVIPPALTFSELNHRLVQSNEGPALELNGLVSNAGVSTLEPEVLLRLSGKRLAIEEPLRLGLASLPPGAERPFTVRIVLPQGVQSVSLLPTDKTSVVVRSLPVISPAWTTPDAL